MITGARSRSVVAALLLVTVAGCATSPGTAAPDALAGASAMPAMSMSGQLAPSQPASTLLDPAAFAAARAEPGRVSIDVHIPFEGKLGSTDLQIPYDEIVARQAALPTDRATPLAIYCRSGNMSAIAAPELAALGFTDIVELAGGMDAWVADGRTLITTP